MENFQYRYTTYHGIFEADKFCDFVNSLCNLFARVLISIENLREPAKVLRVNICVYKTFLP